jgi:hypothetical protein
VHYIDRLQKIEVSGSVLLLVILSLAILPQVSFGQTPTLDNLHLSSNEPQPQCLDFNQDRVCEFVVFTNGTMVENPDTVKQITQVQSQVISESTPIEGKCLGKINPRTHVCPYMLLDNGTVIDNPNNETLVSVIVDPKAYAINSDWYKRLVTEGEQIEDGDPEEVFDTTGGGDNDGREEDESKHIVTYLTLLILAMTAKITAIPLDCIHV